MIHTRAAVSRAAGRPYVLEDVTLDPLRPDEVLVRIAGAGMCHTDMLPRNPAMGVDFGPIILGHEGSGVVEQIDVNGAPFNPRAPFGGYKQSGIGREIGDYGLADVLEVKAVQL